MTEFNPPKDIEEARENYRKQEKLAIEHFHNYVKEYDKTLTKFPYSSCIFVRHGDGTEYRFKHAIAIDYTVELPESHEINYLVVYTEHNKIHIFNKTDLDHYESYVMQPASLDEVVLNKDGKLLSHLRAPIPKINF